MFDFNSIFLDKVSKIREDSINPYPTDLSISHNLKTIHSTYDYISAGEKLEDVIVSVGGRVKYRNRMGKVIFLRIEDRDSRLQIMVLRPEVGDEIFNQVKNIDIGDWIWCRGFIMKTEAGELSIRVQDFKLASKIMTTFPDQYHGFNDTEDCARKRYIDLMINNDTRKTFLMRSKIVRTIRNIFDSWDFVEVETSTLQSIPGGATALPFKTFHNQLQQEFYLRIAPELNLKRLMVGGLDKVFEIGTNWRNEGVSSRHNPAFTSIEWYEAYATFEKGMLQLEFLFKELLSVIGCPNGIIEYGNIQINFNNFRRISMETLIAEFTGLSTSLMRDVNALSSWWNTQNEVAENISTYSQWWELIFNKYIEHTLIDPTFVTGFPVEMSPLARRNDLDNDIADRFELYIAGQEIANGFNELADPVDQSIRFEEQAKKKANGDNEAMFFDADYVNALTYALPPTQGVGAGIDRIVMLLTNNTSIKDVILFPTLGKKSD